MGIGRAVKTVIVFGSIATSVGVGTLVYLSSVGTISISDKNKTYSCTFNNYDGTTLYWCEVKPDHNVTYRGPTPEKPRTEHFTYQFIGWDRSLQRIEDNTIFTAQFEEIANDIIVRFVNYDGELLYETECEYGDDVFYAGTKPTRPSDGFFAYTFTGWDGELENITTDTTFVAQYEETYEKYKVYFFDWDETLIYVDEVFYGNDAKYEGPSLIRESSKEGFRYTFTGWSDSVANITCDKSVIALYKEERTKFDVTFYDFDGTILYIDSVEYGDSAKYLGPEPHRQSDANYEYEFIGWDKTFDVIKADLEVTAQYVTSSPDCRVTFKNYDGTLLDEQTVAFGKSAIYSGEVPTRPSDDEYDYIFIGWDRDIKVVNRTMTTVAQYEKYVKYYRVTFKNYDGSVIKSYKVPYGDDASQRIDFGTPSRPSDETYRYEFKEWSDDITFINKDIEPVAIFEAIPLKVTNGTQEEGQGGMHGDHGMPPGGGGGGGFNSGDLAIVKFFNWDYDYLDADAVIVGNDAFYDEEKPLPSRAADKKYSNYVFCSWDHTLTGVVKGFNTFAQYQIEDGLFTQYIVSFRNDDGTLLYESVCHEGEMPTIPAGFTPNSRVHEQALFLGWDRQLTKVTESYTVYAKYEPIVPMMGGGGDIPSKGDKKSDGEILAYKTKYKGHLYFRLGNFGDFRNNSWDSAPLFDGTDEEFSPLFLTNNKLLVTDMPDYDMSLRYIECNEAAVMPYYVGTSFAATDKEGNVTAEGELTTSGDVTINHQQTLNYEINYVPADLSENLLSELQNVSYSSTHKAEKELEYRSYVNSKYLKVSDNQKAYLNQFVNDNNMDVSSYKGILEVRDKLASYAEYNPKYEDYPAGEDTVLFFLREAKEGVAPHFASALTLIYRSLGIPARYTMGYSSVANGDDSKEIKVTGKNLHFWTEIYLEGIGWVCVDACPGQGIDGGQQGAGGGGGGGGQGEGGQGGGQGGGGGGGAPGVSPSISRQGMSHGSDDYAKRPAFKFVTIHSGTVYFKEYACADIAPSHDSWYIAEPYINEEYEQNAYYLTSDKLKQLGNKDVKLTVMYDMVPELPDVPTYTTSTDVNVNDASAEHYDSWTMDYNFIYLPTNATLLQKMHDTEYSSPEYAAFEAEYSQYVKDTYLTVPDEYKEFFAQFIEENYLSCDSYESILDVTTFISTYCMYNYYFDPIPADADPILYFLTESREGICNNFASALTMLYRSLGIPARFTCGYVGISGGSEYVPSAVTNGQAHAWTEIYLDGIGWVTVDGTGSGIGPEGGGGQEQEKDPYNPFGTLKGDPILTIDISPISTSKNFDGKEMGVVGSVTGEFLSPGEHVDFAICETETKVGSYITRARPRIINAEGQDVTRKYIGKVQLNFYEYSINKTILEIQTASDSKVRDGTPLTCEEYEFINGTALPEGFTIEFEFTGSQNKPGMSNNTVNLSTFRILDEKGNDVTANFEVTWHYGKLIIT